MERNEALVRLIIGLILLINSILTSKGINPIPLSEDELYEIISWILTVAAALWGWWWKNNNITDEASQAQEYLDMLKSMNKEEIGKGE